MVGDVANVSVMFKRDVKRSSVVRLASYTTCKKISYLKVWPA